MISAKKIPSPVKPPGPVPKIEQPLGNLARRNVRPGRFVKHPWDGLAEIELMRDLCRRDFWTFFLYAFGYGINPLGNRWIEPEIHEPLARWFQKHVEEWESWRKAGSRKQKKLAVIMHRKGGKTTLITRAGQLWLHLRDPEISTYTGSENTANAGKMLAAIKAVVDGSDHYALWTKLYGNWAGTARTWAGREVVHAARKNTARQDPSLGVFGVETSITGAHPDAIFYDDPVSYERLKSDTDWLATVNSQVSSLIPVLQSDGLLVWPGCIEVGRPILMSEGSWKPIETVVAGETVYTIDENGRTGIRRVEASIDQGTAETVLVTTKSGTLRCTPWHPFLVARNGDLSWVRADALKHKDLVVTVKEAPSKTELPWVTKDLAWLCGVIMGDGWIGKNADYACIALSKDEALSERIISVLEDWIPDSQFHRTAFGYVRCNSRAAAQSFRYLGLVGGAKTKRVPTWVFCDTNENRIAFLRGFCEADGHKNKRGDDSWSVEISNSDLIRDLRLLARICGVRVGMERPERERWIKAPSSRERILSKTSASNFNFATSGCQERPDTDGGNRPYRQEARAARKIGDNFRLDRVVSVEPAGRCQVWDLTVEGSRSFICDGYVVHNTRYDDEDHFGVAFRDDGVASLEGMETDSLRPEEGGEWHVYFMAARDRQGKPTHPKVWSEGGLKSYQHTNAMRYASQVMNDPAISAHNPLTKEQIEQCWIDPKEVPWSALRFAICCDTAFSDGKKIAGKDETVFIVHGYPRNGSGDVYVIEGHGSHVWRAEDFATRLVACCQRYRGQGRKIFRITDETTRAGKKGVWNMALRNRFADAGEPFPGGGLLEFERGDTKKYARLSTASSFWVDGHVRVLKGAPGAERLMEQMAKIGQYAVNPRTKIDWADAHSDAFQPELYQPMRRVDQQRSPWEKGATLIGMDGLNPRDFEDDDLRRWRNEVPREPLTN